MKEQAPVAPQVDTLQQKIAQVAAEHGVAPESIQVVHAQGPATGKTVGQGPLLTGERQTGVYSLPSGATISSEVTGDGMKQERYVGPVYPRETWKNAAEFHAAKGVATPEELERVNGANAAKPSRMRRALGAMGIGRH